jgi:hypothetical protein
MDLHRVLQGLPDALATGNSARDRLRNGRRFVIGACLTALWIEFAPQHTLPGVLRLAAASPNRSAQRDCAILLLHALAVPGLVSAEAYPDVCSLAEDTLRPALLRCDYPFGGSPEARLGALQRLHPRIAELMEPLEPTFPNWQGLYAG